MTEENSNAEAQQATPANPPTQSGGMLKYIIIGLVAVVVVVGVSVVALQMMSGGEDQTGSTEPVQVATPKEETPQAKTDAHDQAHTPSAEEIAAELNEGMAAESEDTGVLSNIMDNLAFLDYEPSQDDLSGMETGMSVEDSIENMNWLDSEKARLSKREKELDRREQEVNTRYRELKKLDDEVNRKLLTLDQAETARVASLAKLYDGMDPRAVAQLAGNLDDETMVALIPRMKNKNASALLALLPPQRAARLSKKMITISEK